MKKLHPVAVGLSAVALLALAKGKGLRKEEKLRREASLELFGALQEELGKPEAAQKAVELYRTQGGKDEAFIARLNTLGRKD